MALISEIRSRCTEQTTQALAPSLLEHRMSDVQWTTLASNSVQIEIDREELIEATGGRHQQQSCGRIL